MIINWILSKFSKDTKENIILGLAAVLVVGFAAWLVFGFAAVLVVGFAAGLVVGLAAWLAAWLAAVLVVGFAAVLVVGFAAGLVVGFAAVLVVGLVAGLAFGLVFGVFPIEITFILAVLIALEILYWLDKKKKPAKMNKWLFVAERKAEAALDVGLALGTIPYILEAQKHYKEIVDAFGVFGYYSFMLSGVIGIVGIWLWINGLKYREKPKKDARRASK